MKMNPIQLSYQLLQAQDVSSAIQFALTTRQLLFPELYQTQIPTDIQYFKQYYIESCLGCFMVVKDKDKIIASIAYRGYDQRFQLDVPKNSVEVVKLFVLAEYRRQGIATRLCQLLFEQARQKGIDTLYLHTHPFLPAAEKFWTLQGFTVVKREWLKTYDTIHMLKAINP